MDVQSRTNRDLLELYIAVMSELRQRKVVRSANQPVGDVAELLVAKHFDVALASQSTRGYDLRAQPSADFPQGERIEVKARRVSKDVRASHYSFFRGLDNKPPPFDALVVVHFNDRFDAVGAWKMTVGYVRERVGALNVRTGGQRLALIKEGDLADKRVVPIVLPSIDEIDPSELL
jgi:hypothetical protein